MQALDTGNIGLPWKNRLRPIAKLIFLVDNCFCVDFLWVYNIQINNTIYLLKCLKMCFRGWMKMSMSKLLCLVNDFKQFFGMTTIFAFWSWLWHWLWPNECPVKYVKDEVEMFECASFFPRTLLVILMPIICLLGMHHRFEKEMETKTNQWDANLMLTS